MELAVVVSNVCVVIIGWILIVECGRTKRKIRNFEIGLKALRDLLSRTTIRYNPPEDDPPPFGAGGEVKDEVPD